MSLPLQRTRRLQRRMGLIDRAGVVCVCVGGWVGMHVYVYVYVVVVTMCVAQVRVAPSGLPRMHANAADVLAATESAAAAETYETV